MPRRVLQTSIHFPMHLSIVIPVFNEERLIERCLQSISASLVANSTPGFTSEINYVVDNNSTDNTANLARQAGAQVVFEPTNQILGPAMPAQLWRQEIGCCLWMLTVC